MRMSMDELNARDEAAIRTAAPVAPVNLRVEMSPYPHLRDDNGCVLAPDYFEAEKLAFILSAVKEKIERENLENQLTPESGPST